MLENDLTSIVKEIDRVTGVDTSLYRESTLKRRLGLRLTATNSKNYKEYLKVLKQNASEYEVFLQTLTINVTDFFRDKEVYFSLKRNILPKLIQRARDLNRKRIRIWSTGCSRGQEPYSMAILFHVMLDGGIKDFQVAIHATDLDEIALQKAKSGLYTGTEVKNVPKTYLKKYFLKKNGYYQLKKEVKRLVRFKQLDLIKESLPGKFDLILCRNLLIFFEPQLQKILFEKFNSSLKAEGILVLGKSETVSYDSLFNCISPKDHFYLKASKGVD